MGPDENVYLAQARALQTHGIRRGFRLAVSRFLEEPAAKHFPSPIRWLWLLVLRLTLRTPLAVPVASALALAPAAWWAFGIPWLASALCLTSPLLWITSRRVWVDAPVALLTILGLGFAIRGEPVGLAASVFALMALREASVLILPALAVAWFLGGHAPLPLGASLATAGAAWLVGCRICLGPQAIRVLRTAIGGHETEYTELHQSGGVHRLLTDLFLLSPAACLIAVATFWVSPLAALLAFVLVLATAFAPVNNVRTLLSADILVRVVAASAFVQATGYSQVVIAAVAFWFATELRTLHATRKVYDPVTANLTAALGMSPRT